MVLKLEKIGQITLVDKNGKPSTFFQTLWQRTITAIQTAVNTNADFTAQLAQQLALLQATQAAANSAQQSANAAQAAADAAGGGTARSDSATFSTTISGLLWINGPTIALPTVSAGNLTISGTGPTSGTLLSGVSVIGEYRVVELAGGTTIFTGSMVVNDTGVTDNSAADVAAFSLAETTTGTVSYRLDVRRSGGPSGTSADISMYFYCRRS